MCGVELQSAPCPPAPYPRRFAFRVPCTRRVSRQRRRHYSAALAPQGFWELHGWAGNEGHRGAWGVDLSPKHCVPYVYMAPTNRATIAITKADWLRLRELADSSGMSMAELYHTLIDLGIATIEAQTAISNHSKDLDVAKAPEKVEKSSTDIMPEKWRSL